MRTRRSMVFLAAVAAVCLVFSGKTQAITIEVTGQVDCGDGTAAVISGLGGQPLFSGAASTGDLLHVVLAGGSYFEAIIDGEGSPPEVTVSGSGTPDSENVGITIYLTDAAGDPATTMAGLSLNSFLAGFGDGVSLLSDPAFIYDFDMVIRQWESADVTRTFTLSSVTVVDRPNEGPDITFREGAPGTAVIPEPATLMTFASGCAGLLAAAWRRRRKAGNNH